jgi:hypothetical protein
LDASAEEEWNQEIAGRIAELDSGKVKSVPWAEADGRFPPFSMTTKTLEIHPAALAEFKSGPLPVSPRDLCHVFSHI